MNRSLMVAALSFFVAMISPKTSAAAEMADPYLWLEEVVAERPLAWARERNAESLDKLRDRPEFEAIRTRLLTALDSDERIPGVTKYGSWYYNFWQDATHPRGLLRRTSFEEYRKESPVWETVLDLDTLAEKENENWVWKGFSPVYPERDRALLQLSRGGADAVVVREFDLLQRAFVADGFVIPEAKTRVQWRDRDSLYVGTDFGDGSLTESGYPRTIRLWHRGESLAEAKEVFAGTAEDVSVGAIVANDRGHRYEFAVRSTSFWTDEGYLRRDDEWVKIDKPDGAEVDVFADQLLLTLRDDWDVEGHHYEAGSLIAIAFADFWKGSREFTVLFEPTDRKSLAGTDGTLNWLIVNELEDVKNQLVRWRLNDGQWTKEAMPAPGVGTVSVSGVDPHESDAYWLSVTDFVTPPSLYHGTIGNDAPEKLKSTPAFFDADGLTITQHFASSADGTRVPYFEVRHRDAKDDGTNPTLLYGYGGFEIPMLSRYSARVGIGWLERGGVYVVANIRGGGEYGPRWHQAALRENRQKAYDDFAAVAEDLIRRKVTGPSRLGIRGGSNGGLLMGNMLVQRPELFGAVVCQVPLLDMKRYHLLLAGASWMAEYGDPDKPEDWAFLNKYSPYQLLDPEADYPPVLVTTSTRDDRVHPGHARKFVARMKEQGHEVLYYENIEGGHGGAANNEQMAFMDALAYTFLWAELGAETPGEGE